MSPEMAFLVGVAVGTVLTRIQLDVVRWVRSRRRP